VKGSARFQPELLLSTFYSTYIAGLNGAAALDFPTGSYAFSSPDAKTSTLHPNSFDLGTGSTPDFRMYIAGYK